MAKNEDPGNQNKEAESAITREISQANKRPLWQFGVV
jgi:hypothetical protein